MPSCSHDPVVQRCVAHVMAEGHDKGSAIPICQASIGESYHTAKSETKAEKEARISRDGTTHEVYKEENGDWKHI